MAQELKPGDIVLIKYIRSLFAMIYDGKVVRVRNVWETPPLSASPQGFDVDTSRDGCWSDEAIVLKDLSLVEKTHYGVE